VFKISGAPGAGEQKLGLKSRRGGLSRTQSGCAGNSVDLVCSAAYTRIAVEASRDGVTGISLGDQNFNGRSSKDPNDALTISCLIRSAEWATIIRLKEGLSLLGLIDKISLFKLKGYKS
jgi:hypothetical protein